MKLAHFLEALAVCTALSGLHLGLQPQPEARLAGCFLGLLTQPYWFWIASRAKSFGTFVIAGAYTVVWFNGFIAAWRGL